MMEQTKLDTAGSRLGTLMAEAKSGRKYAGLETGFVAVDEAINGLQNLVVLGGIAGAGKTTLALQMALGVARVEKIPVMFISYEINESDLTVMAMQNLSGKTLCRKTLLKSREAMTPEEEINYQSTLAKLTEIGSRFYFVDHSKISLDIADIRKNILAVKELNQVENLLVVIDSFDDLLVANKVGDRAESQEEAIVQLERLQQETNATILAVAQKDRNKLQNSRQEGLRGDISLYHKPTIVLELISYKEILEALDNEGRAGTKLERLRIEEMIAENEIPAPTTLYVSKHRNGASQNIHLQLHGAYRVFEDGKVAEFSNLNKYRLYSYFEV